MEVKEVHQAQKSQKRFYFPSSIRKREEEGKTKVEAEMDSSSVLSRSHPPGFGVDLFDKMDGSSILVHFSTGSIKLRWKFGLREP